jgi:hypothetical protein
MQYFFSEGNDVMTMLGDPGCCSVVVVPGRYAWGFVVGPLSGFVEGGAAVGCRMHLRSINILLQ